MIPAEHFNAPPVLEEAEFLRWIVARRVQAMGLLRLSGDAALWNGYGVAATRARALQALVEMGTLTQVQIREPGTPIWNAYLPTSALPLLNEAPDAPRVIFLAPLDNLLWDRRVVAQLFDFEYIWEVYTGGYEYIRTKTTKPPTITQ